MLPGDGYCVFYAMLLPLPRLQTSPPTQGPALYRVIRLRRNGIRLDLVSMRVEGMEGVQLVPRLLSISPNGMWREEEVVQLKLKSRLTSKGMAQALLYPQLVSLVHLLHLLQMHLLQLHLLLQIALPNVLLVATLNLLPARLGVKVQCPVKLLLLHLHLLQMHLMHQHLLQMLHLLRIYLFLYKIL